MHSVNSEVFIMEKHLLMIRLQNHLIRLFGTTNYPIIAAMKVIGGHWSVELTNGNTIRTTDLFKSNSEYDYV